jgi:threonine synthase
MLYRSTNKNAPLADFRGATLQGQAPDRGLYFPCRIPDVDPHLIKSIEQLTDQEIALEVIRPYVGETIAGDILKQIVDETLNFDIPLKKLENNSYVLELFHGPTMAFKDVGARFMSRCLGYFLREEKRKVTVLVATSGDTGGAVADGFYGVSDIRVVILYPSGKVSPVQEKQLTVHGGNIHALEIKGSFDQCQQMVKDAFADKQLSQQLFLTSANSINIARWLPQQFYYFSAYRQWPDKQRPPVISVPSGNFGNICAGMLAQCSRLPVKHFIAACNENDVVTRFLSSGEWDPSAVIPTLSNAMDVGDPSNFVRILSLFQDEYPPLKQSLSSYSISDVETIEVIKEMWAKNNYLLDPHGAVAYLSLQRWIKDHPLEKGIFLETAHPLKFPTAIEQATGKTMVIPASLSLLMSKQKKSQLMEARSELLKEYLFSL